jgi:hypothetical protein
MQYKQKSLHSLTNFYHFAAKLTLHFPVNRGSMIFKWLVFFLLISSAAFSQQIVEGKVIDKETRQPVPFASIGIIGLPRGTSSNIDGEFSISVPATFSMKVTCLGYESIILNSIEEIKLIELKPVATQLEEVVILSRAVNPSKIVQKAFARIPNNYNTKSFLQKFFYRQYSKTDATYERLIEASVDLWKEGGYKKLRTSSGENEGLRVTQLRRSLDIKGMVQGQTPIFFGNILQTDFASYQKSKPAEYLSVFDEVSNLKIDFNRYKFTFSGITRYDGQEVYQINYESLPDSILTTSGYVKTPSAKGSLFITTDTYAFIKTEDVRDDGLNTIKSSAYYLKHKENYYPYHLVREGESRHQNTHYFHAELMAVEINHDKQNKFNEKALTRASLLNIPYDSSFWSSSTILKTTPLEDKIIRGLGGGQSLNKQFYLYKQYELNVTNGGVNGEDKFNWFKNDSKDKRSVYVLFWNSDFKNYLVDMEYVKRFHQEFGSNIAFVLISLEEDEAVWNGLVKKFNYFSDGLINYRIGSNAKLLKQFNVKKLPACYIITKDGEVQEAKSPSNPGLKDDLKSHQTQTFKP